MAICWPIARWRSACFLAYFSWRSTGCGLTEADVVRQVFGMLCTEGRSCQYGRPPQQPARAACQHRDGRDQRRTKDVSAAEGKRTVHMAGISRPGLQSCPRAKTQFPAREGMAAIVDQGSVL